MLSTLFLRELARLRDKLSISTRWVRVPHKEKARPAPPPRDKAILPVFESSIIGAARLSCLIFSRYTEGAQQYTGRVPAARERPSTPPPHHRGIIGLRSALSQLSHRRKRTARLIIPKPFLYHYADSPYRLPPSSCSFSITLLGTRTVGKRGEGMGDGRLQKRELERRSTKRGRNGGEGGEGEGGPPFIPETELPVRSHSTNLGSWLFMRKVSRHFDFMLISIHYRRTEPRKSVANRWGRAYEGSAQVYLRPPNRNRRNIAFSRPFALFIRRHLSRPLLFLLSDISRAWRARFDFTCQQMEENGMGKRGGGEGVTSLTLNVHNVFHKGFVRDFLSKL